jgi:hypothetical protein
VLVYVKLENIISISLKGNCFSYLEILISFESFVTEGTLMGSKVTVCNRMGPQCAIGGIHPSTNSTRVLDASVVLFVPI